MDKYLKHNLPQRKSVRLKNWDYSKPGFYFITICTHQNRHLFGEVKNGHTILSSSGKVVQSNWNQIPEKFQNTRLDEFIIMPNHIHGIIQIIDKDNSNLNISTDAINRVRTDIMQKK